MRLLESFAATCVLLSLSAVALCADAKPDAKSTFHDGTVEWVAAYNANEPDRIVALYSADAVVMPPDAASVTGPAALRTYIAGDIAASKKAGVTLALVDENAGTSGDLGWHSGTFKVVGADGATAGTGKYLEIWERQAGTWRITHDIWNNDAAAASATAKPSTP